MELEDAYVAWLEGRPVPQLRHPRRTLRQWLTGRQPEPAPVPPPVSEIVPVWRAVTGRDLDVGLSTESWENGTIPKGDQP